ncbi:ferric reductase [Paenibacillus ginsengarvi]|uniref:Ferric reductase n=1 Tax=Paenibacillus ginsengarvi TaxID=400777 RepID=A0A3B0BM89_9BACL|nr:ferric reductase [Paenibacillus ginsengarvi]RKN74200.1 ferric reductase [Paenibacillus ginsengarvi]
MVQWFIKLPTWELTRLLGLLSYMLLFAGVSVGIVYGMWWKRHKAQLYKVHSFLSVSGTAAALLHTAILVISTYSPFPWSELFIPFSASSNPVLNGIGTIAVYGLLLLILTTDLRNKLKKRLWHRIHLLAYPLWLLCLFHGLLLGTDTKLGAVKLMYAATAAVVVVLTGLRVKDGLTREKLPRGGAAEPYRNSRSAG